MRLLSRKRLSYFFARNPFFLLLLYEPWFGAALIGFFLLVISVALFLPRIWTVSPDEFVPIVKVSGLDLAQAWSLKRTATAATAAGRFDEAYYAWRAAIVNNQADPELLRGALRTFLKDERPFEHNREALRQSSWLLKLTKTNLADLELTSQVFVRVGYLDLLLSLLEPRQDRLTPALESCYLKALFNRGKINAFKARMDTRKLPSDPELPLYRSAYVVGWGPRETREAAQEHLESAMRQPEHRILACRLQLAVHAHLHNLDRYEKALRCLEEWKSDTLLYHVGYWRLLFLSGRKAEAIDLLKSFSAIPGTVLETIKFAELCDDLGLREHALQFLKQAVPRFDEDANFWIFYTDLLMQAKQWEEVRRLAWHIRAHEAIRGQLHAYGYFLEGRAEFALGRHYFAESAFKNLADWEINDAQLGFSMAKQLLEIGHPIFAQVVLRKLERELHGNANYWGLLFNVADELKQVDLMLEASRRAFQLRPDDPVTMNNYAASLIISRNNHEELIRLTFQLFSQNPRSLVAAVNHGAALLLNQRHRDAEALLRSVNTTKLTRPQATLYHFDLFELYVGLREFERAWAVGKLIDQAHLYPTQRQWLEQTWKQLASLSKEG